MLTFSRPRFLDIVREVILALPWVALVYFMVRQSGPWQWLVEMQLALFGVFFSNYTWCFCFFVALLASIALHVALAMAGWQGKPFLVQLGLDVLAMPSWAVGIMFIGIVFGALGFSDYLSIALAGQQTFVPARDLEGGTRPSSRWLVTDGRPLVDQSVTWEKNGKVERHTMPLVSADWKNAEPVAIVVTINSELKWKDVLGGKPAQGIASLSGMPGLERSSMENRGLRFAADPIYLVYDDDPQRTATRGGIVAAIGAGVALAVVLTAQVLSFRRRSKRQIKWDWNLGERCFARSRTDGCYYAAIIQQEVGSEFQVRLDSGEEVWVDAQSLASAELPVGTRVQARWKGGSVYFHGKVMQRNADGVYIHYDDGDQEWTILEMLRLRL
jgi:hypothetical protein